MKRLIVMRHAKSDWSFDKPDIDRPLNPRGVRSARALGSWLTRRGYAPEAALVSAAVRTRETWGLLGLNLQASFLPALYHAAPDTILSCIGGARADTLLVLGHNPGIALFAQQMVSDPPAHERFDDYPTAATLVVDFDVAEWDAIAPHAGQPVDFVVGRDLTD